MQLSDAILDPGSKNLKKITPLPLQKKKVPFRKTELSCSKIKKFLFIKIYISGNGNPEIKFLIFSQKKLGFFRKRKP